MNPPDLRALQRGDPDAWDEAFRWLWPVAFAVAELKLKPYLPGDVEDVAIETLEEIVDKVLCCGKRPDCRIATGEGIHSRANHTIAGRARRHLDWIIFGRCPHAPGRFLGRGIYSASTW